jgi:Domain of unknown function (DUF1844)
MFIMSDDQKPEAARDDHEEPVTFLGFVLSLAATAALHFGDMPDPQTGQPPAPNLEAAAHLIDILALLEQKTRGNLTAEERSVLDQVLYELRLRYVEAKKPQSRIIQP